MSDLHLTRERAPSWSKPQDELFEPVRGLLPNLSIVVPKRMVPVVNMDNVFGRQGCIKEELGFFGGNSLVFGPMENQNGPW